MGETAGTCSRGRVLAPAVAGLIATGVAAAVYFPLARFASYTYTDEFVQGINSPSDEMCAEAPAGAAIIDRAVAVPGQTTPDELVAELPGCRVVSADMKVAPHGSIFVKVVDGEGVEIARAAVINPGEGSAYAGTCPMARIELSENPRHSIRIAGLGELGAFSPRLLESAGVLPLPYFTETRRGSGWLKDQVETCSSYHIPGSGSQSAETEISFGGDGVARRAVLSETVGDYKVADPD